MSDLNPEVDREAVGWVVFIGALECGERGAIDEVKGQTEVCLVISIACHHHIDTK